MFQIEILSGVLAALAGTVFPLTRELLRVLRSGPHAARFFRSSFGVALLTAFGLGATAGSPNKLFAELSETSEKLDAITSRIQAYTRVREAAVSELETRLEKLSAQEGQLKATIEQLQNIPLPAAEHFAELVKKQEKGSALRDYILFISGVVVSAIIAIGLKHFGIG